MKSLRIYSLLVLSAVVALTSCDKSLNVDGKSKQKMVLNGILKAGDTIKVQLSKTRSLFDDEDKIDWIRNADVYLRCGQNEDAELLKYGKNGIYASEDHLAAYGEEYSIEVVHNTYDNISASAVMPEYTEGSVKYIGDIDDQQNFEINIQNHNPNNNYIWEMMTSNDLGALENVEIFSEDSRTDNILPEETQVQRRIFMRGQTENELATINSNFSASGITYEQMSSTEIRLITVNQDMYKYFRSLELYKNSKNNFVKPIEIYSNVDNGLGIFGAISETSLSITY